MFKHLFKKTKNTDSQPYKPYELPVPVPEAGSPALKSPTSQVKIMR